MRGLSFLLILFFGINAYAWHKPYKYYPVKKKRYYYHKYYKPHRKVYRVKKYYPVHTTYVKTKVVKKEVVYVKPVRVSQYWHHGSYYHHPKRYYAPAPNPWFSRQKLGISLKLSSILLEGEKLSLNQIENPTLGGLGVMVRANTSPNFGLELSFDYLTASPEDYKQTTMPITLSGIFYLFPRARINPYGVVGGGVHITQLSYLNGAYIKELWELAGHVGAGIQIRLSKEFVIFGDFRFMSVYKNISDVDITKYEQIYKEKKGVDPKINYSPDDKFNLGMQLQAGFIYYF